TFPLYGQPVDLGEPLWDQLQRRTVPLPTAKPARRRILPREVNTALRIDEPALLDQLFFSQLRERKVPVKRVSSQVTRVTYQGEERWFQGISSTRDRGSATAVIRRADHAHRVLRFQGINRPGTRLKVNSHRLEETRRSSNSKWVMFSGRRLWPGREQLAPVAGRFLTPEILNDYEWPMIQRFVEGDLYRVIATPHAHLLVLSPHKGRHRDITPAASLAVEAVQAIPHLSIASVDVVVPRKSNAAPIVDGMSLNPTIHPDWWISAGSFDHVWDYLLTDH
ncbi:MAG TPA: hypothetical protein VK054_02785, partial [Beutenbergiaceae bacterium]|nr:hypothetical protein [Beutenbergiaceae bacterium]